MYWHVNYVKLLWSTIGTLLMILLGGCPSAPVVNGSPEPQIPPVVTPEVDTIATYHIVKRGETLAAIAQRFGRNYLDIAKWNNISPPYIISIGQRLRVDGPGMPPVMPEAGIPVVTPAPPPPTPVITPPVSEPPDYSGNTYTVQTGDTLFSIAKLHGQNFQDVADWNNIKPPYNLGVGQIIKVLPPDGWRPASPIIEPVTPPSPIENIIEKDHNYHIVLAGDTLYKIANHYGFSVANVAAWNGLHEPYNLSIGQKLRISPPSGDNEFSVPPTNIPPPTIETPVDNENGYHIVIIGDTLYSLSRRYGQSVADLARWNNLPPPYDLSLGQRLRVIPPVTMMPELTPQQNLDIRPVGLKTLPGYHIVKRKETLHAIAKKYGVSLLDLANWNGIGSPYTVYPGQRLTIIPH